MKTESRPVRIKRMKMRAMRRGIKEMDLILSAYAERELDTLDTEDLDLFDSLLSENDQDLYAWITGQAPAPPQYHALIDTISSVFQP